MSIFLGDKLVTYGFLGDLPVRQTVLGNDFPIPLDGLLFFLNGTDYAGSGDWLSVTGSLPITASLFGTPTYDSNNQVFSFNSASGFLTQTEGLNLSTSSYSIFYTGRYSGSAEDKHGRLLVSLTPDNNPQNSSYNWTLGMYSGSYQTPQLPDVGPAYVASNTGLPGDFILAPSGSYDTLWRSFGVTGNYLGLATIDVSVFVNGNEETSSIYQAAGLTPTGPLGFGINTGSYTTGTNVNPAFENSICEIGDVIVYNRVLTQTEIEFVTNYLNNRVGI